VAVFTSKSIILRAVPDPITDDTLPSPGALNWKAITTPAALAGTVGVDVKLVHGDYWSTIQGNMTLMVGGNLMTTVSKNQIWTVMTNSILTIMGTYIKTVIGTHVESYLASHIQLHLASSIYLFVGAHTEVHCAPRTIVEPTGWYKVIGFKGEIVAVSNVLTYVAKTEVNTSAWAFNLYKLEITLVKTEAKVTDNKLKMLATNAEVLKALVGALRGKVNAAHVKASVEAAVGPQVAAPPVVFGN
jgi:hypothetical protein